ncbi:MAG: Dabb family protein [Candidatus Thiodiazotropha endolucinida]
MIDSYREHPDHVAFADNHFRPVAGDRVSIDYQGVEDRGTLADRDKGIRRSA